LQENGIVEKMELAEKLEENFFLLSTLVKPQLVDVCVYICECMEQFYNIHGSIKHIAWQRTLKNLLLKMEEESERDMKRANMKIDFVCSMLSSTVLLPLLYI
jgi:hypothetical protein